MRVFERIRTEFHRPLKHGAFWKVLLLLAIATAPLAIYLSLGSAIFGAISLLLAATAALLNGVMGTKDDPRPWLYGLVAHTLSPVRALAYAGILAWMPLLLLAGTKGYEQLSRVDLIVVSEDGAPIPDLRVAIGDDPGHKTDAQGKIEKSVRPGITYDLHVFEGKQSRKVSVAAIRPKTIVTLPPGPPPFRIAYRDLDEAEFSSLVKESSGLSIVPILIPTAPFTAAQELSTHYVHFPAIVGKTRPLRGLAKRLEPAGWMSIDRPDLDRLVQSYAGEANHAPVGARDELKQRARELSASVAKLGDRYPGLYFAQFPAPDCGGGGPPAFQVASRTLKFEVLLIENPGSQVLEISDAVVREINGKPRTTVEHVRLLQNAAPQHRDLFPLRQLKPGEGLVVTLSTTASFEGTSQEVGQPPVVLGPGLKVDSLKVDSVTYPIRSRSETPIAIRRGGTDHSCPFIYTSSGDAQTKISWGTAITDYIGIGRKGFSETQFDRFYPLVTISEEEPEISFLDMVYMSGRDRAGRQVRVFPSGSDVLRRVDNRYLILRNGQQAELRFEPPPGGFVGGTTLHVNGYYVPTPAAVARLVSGSAGQSPSAR